MSLRPAEGINIDVRPISSTNLYKEYRQIVKSISAHCGKRATVLNNPFAAFLYN